MAESYRGLTIRIGGDTTKLQQALKAVNGSITGTNAELRKLGTALRLDPSSVEAYNAQLGYMGQQATNTAMKLSQLEAAREEISKRTMKTGAGDDASVKTVQELASSTENAALSAELARSKYVQLETSLAKIDNQVTQLAADARDVEAARIAEQFSKFPTDGVDAIITEVGKLPDAIRASDGEVERFSSTVDALAKQWEKANGDASQQEEITRRYQAALREMLGSGGQTFNVAEGTNSARQLEEALRSIAGTLDLDEAAITSLIARTRELKGSFADAKVELTNANEVQRFEDLNVEITKTEASIRSVERAMASMAVPSDVSRGMYELNANVSALEQAYRQLSSSAQAMGSVLAFDPSNTQALSVAMNVLTESERNVAEEAARIRSQIDGYDTAAIEAYTDHSKSATQQLFDAATAAEKSRDAYDRLSGQLAAAQREYDLLKNAVTEADMNLRKSAESSSQEAQQAQRAASAEKERADRMAELDTFINGNKENLEKLRVASESASKALEMSKARAEVESLRPALVEVESRVKEVDLAARNLASAFAESVKARGIKDMFGDMYSVDSVVTNFAESFKSAMSRVGSFDSLLNIDPSKLDAVQAKAQAMSDAIVAGRQSIASMQAAMSQMDSSAIEEIRQRYVTVDNAVASTTAATAALVERVREAKTALAESVSGKGYDELREKILDVSVAMDKFHSFDMTDDVRKSRQALLNLIADLEAAKAASANAAQAQKWQEYEAKVAETRAQVAEMNAELRKSASGKVELLSERAVSSTFKGVIDQVARFDEAIDAAKAKAGQLTNALAGDPMNKNLMAERAKAMAEAMELTRQKAQLLNETVAKFSAGAIGSEIDSIKQKVQEFATANNLGDSFVKQFMDAKSSIAEIPPELEKLREKVLVLDNVGQQGSATLGLSEAKKALTETETELARLQAKVQEFAASNGKSNAWVQQFMDAKSKISDIPPELEVARARIVELGNAKPGQEMQVWVAAIIEALGQMRTEAMTAAGTLKNEFDGAGSLQIFDEAALQQVVDRISGLVSRIGQEIVASSNTIDSAYRDMRKTVQGTEEQFESLRASAIEFSKTRVTSADTLLEMEALGGQLGVAVTNLHAFGENVSNLDIATNMQAEDIALKLGQITNVMRDLDGSTFDNFADSLVRLGNNTATTESAIMNVAQRMSSVATVTNMTTPELLAWSAAIASTGQRSESAATAISNTIVGISAAVSKGGATLQQFGNIAGMTAEEFESAWKNSSSDALEAFVKGLAVLSDDSTEAIDALNSVGISSVRQRSAILSLSQTIDNLDDSMTMSKDAFEGVGDQWGAAGDAAREAQRKSEGFSGSLGILQNNATALAASLGEGMVPIMKALSSAIGVVSDFMSGLPEPIKQAVVVTGGLAAAFSAVSAALRGLGIDNAITQLLGLTAAQEGATLATKASAAATEALSIAQSALPILAVVTAVTMLANVIGKYVEDANLAIDASRNLNEAMEGVSGQMQKISESGSTDKYTAMAEAGDAAREGLESIRDFAEGAVSAMSEIAQSTAIASEYADTIKELSSKAALTKEEQQQLTNAVSQYNDVTGAAVEVTDAVTGRLNIMTGQIDEVTDAYERNATKQAYLDLYNDAIKNVIENQERLKQAQGKVIPFTETLEETAIKAGAAFAYSGNSVAALSIALGDGLTHWNTYAKAQQNVANLESELADETELRDHFKELYNKATNAGEGFTEFETAMASAGIATSDLGDLTDEERKRLLEIENQLLETGHSLGEFKNINQQKLAQIAAAWNGSVSEILSYIKEIQNSASDADGSGNIVPNDELAEARKRQYDDAYNAEKQYLDDVYRAQQQAYEDENKALQQSFDDQNKAIQRGYDEQNKMLQKQLDAEYKERQKAYDDEYKALQKQLDKEYKARQRQLDADLDALKDKLGDDEDALKDANDDRLQQMKDAHKAEEDALKKSLDAQYNARKKAYDKEQKAYKKELDKQLKALKKSQQAEVKAFRDATNARIKEMRREYDERKKLAEETDGTKQIDDRIKELQDQTKAEQEAAKKKQQDEKKAELQAAVDKAKSRRKRAEAEKALNDYLEELAQEARQKEREAEIERLEDQKDIIKEKTDAAKDALDDERDAAIAAYQEQRDIELDALQERQEAVYDKLKESLDEQAELRKEKYDKQLEDYRAVLDSELEALKARHKAEEDALKKQLDANLQALKDADAKRLDDLKDANSAELELLKEQQQNRLAALKERQQEDLSALKESQKERMDAIKQGQKDELDAIKQGQKDELEARKRAQQDALQDMKRSHEQALKDLKRQQEDELKQYKAGLEAQSKATSDAGKRISDAIVQPVKESKVTLRQLWDDNKLSMKTYLDAANGMPGSMRRVLEELGLTTKDKLAKIAKAMYDDGILEKDEYNRAISGIPGMAEVVYQKLDAKTAERLGILSLTFAQKGKENKDAYMGPMNGMAATDIPNAAAAANGALATGFSDTAGMAANGQAQKDAYMGPLNGMATTDIPNTGSAANQSLAERLGDTSLTQPAAQGAVGAIAGEFGTLPGKAGEAVSATGDSVGLSISVGTPSATGAATGMVDQAAGIFGQLPGQAKSKTADTGSSIGSSINAGGDAARGPARSLTNDIGGIFGEIPANAKAKTAITGSSVGSGISETRGDATNEADSLRSEITGTFAELPEDARSATSGTGSLMGSGISETADSATSSADRLRADVNANWESMPGDAHDAGGRTVSELAGGIDGGSSQATDSAHNVASGVSDHLSSPSDSSWSWGWDMLRNFNDAIVDFWNSHLSDNVENIARGIRDLLGHSTPKEGPLRDDDVWFYHMGQNLNKGLVRSVPALMGTVEGIAEGMEDGLDVSGSSLSDGLSAGLGKATDELGATRDDMVATLGDLASWASNGGAGIVDGIIYGMRERESSLTREMRRISQIVEDGLDVDFERQVRVLSEMGSARLDYGREAATAAIDRLRARQEAGQERMQRQMADAIARAREGGDVDQSVQISIEVREMSVRDTQDLDALARKLSKTIARDIASAKAARLG